MDNGGMKTTDRVPLQYILPGQKTVFDPALLDMAVKEVVINVFVHGTYGAEIAPLNFLKIIQDEDLSGTGQAFFIRNFMRQRAKNLYDVSLMFDEGWWLIDPDAPAAAELFRGFALLPILQGFLKVQQECAKDAAQLCYLFGWSGFLSQDARRRASIALYNGLLQEKAAVEQFLRANDSQAKVVVRVYTHSHGGNVALNLAWVDAHVKGDYRELISVYEHFGLRSLSLKVADKFTQLLESLPAFSASQLPGYAMDAWLFKPFIAPRATLCDELTLLATPIQDETSPAALASSFGLVENYFSFDDAIQTLDLLSTHHHISRRLLSPALVESVQAGYKRPRLRQILLNFVRATPTATSTVNPDLLLGPTHRDYWLIAWNADAQHWPMRPAPIISFMPLLQKYVRQKEAAYQEVLLQKVSMLGLPRIVMSFYQHNALSNKRKLTYQAQIPGLLLHSVNQLFFAAQGDLQTDVLVSRQDVLATKMNWLSRKAIDLLLE